MTREKLHKLLFVLARVKMFCVLENINNNPKQNSKNDSTKINIYKI